jgi:protein O-GlcNAc transferase
MAISSSSDPSPDALNATGIAHARNKRFDQAIAAFERAIALNKNHFDAHNNLGAVYVETRQFDRAIHALQRAASIRPDSADVHYNLAKSYRPIGRLDSAIASYRRAIELKGDYFQAHSNLGALFLSRSQAAQAIECFGRALAIAPNSIEALNNLAAALRWTRKVDEAEDILRRAIALDPRRVAPHNNLGNVLCDQGQIDEALAELRRALELNPTDPEAWDSLLLSMHFQYGSCASDIVQAHARWEELCAKPLYRFHRPHDNDRSPDRPLRIGYISPDFLTNPVGRFLVPVFEGHNRDQFQIFCYSDMLVADATTDRLRQSADHWRHSAAMSDADLAETIRADGIDILVDVTLHAAKNRLQTFARKPAPVQISYLAYNSTSGLSTMDWRMTDIYFDPPNKPSFGIEQVLRLKTYWCYRPPEPCASVGPLPMDRAGNITFGSLNSVNKITPPVVETWARILASVEHSRLIMSCPSIRAQNRVRDTFAGHGVGADRIEFLGHMSIEKYMASYNRIDLMLDPFPYNGGTTTCDSLWMGVPVVNLAGEFSVGRGGFSLLSNIGLTDFIAYSLEEYVKLSVALGHDAQRLGAVRSTLRERMKNSPLMDEAGFARSLESLYRQSWQAWCNG